MQFPPPVCRALAFFLWPVLDWRSRTVEIGASGEDGSDDSRRFLFARKADARCSKLGATLEDRFQGRLVLGHLPASLHPCEWSD
jgi:hypothetical protein